MDHTAAATTKIPLLPNPKIEQQLTNCAHL